MVHLQAKIFLALLISDYFIQKVKFKSTVMTTLCFALRHKYKYIHKRTTNE